MNRFVPGKLRLLALLSAVVCDAPTSALAEIFRVPAEYATIQDAIDATIFEDGSEDTVLVAPGNYPDFQTRGDMSACVFLRDGVVVRSEGGSKVTTIDLSLITGTRRVGIVAPELLSEDTIIEGFSLIGPNAGGFEAYLCGYLCGKVTVRECTFRDFMWGAARATGNVSFVDCEFTNCQVGTGLGGAIWYADGRIEMTGCTVRECNDTAVVIEQQSHQTSVLIDQCLFFDNSAEGPGGAIRISSAHGGVTVSRSLFGGNSSEESDGGALFLGLGSMTVEDCVFIENRAERGGAIGSFEDRIRRCTFFNNHNTSVFGGASSIYAENASIGMNIFYGGSGGAHVALSGTSTWSCNVFWANADGAGVVLSPTDREVDPLFCDVETEDLTLNEGSPCLPNDPLDCGQIGAFGQGCGAVSIEPSTWGAIKGLYR